MAKQNDLEEQHICNTCIFQIPDVVAYCKNEEAKVHDFPQLYCKKYMSIEPAPESVKGEEHGQN